jgi:hypothetical protein
VESSLDKVLIHNLAGVANCHIGNGPPMLSEIG